VQSEAGISQPDLPHGTNNRKVDKKNRKTILKSIKTDILGSIGKQSGESVFRRISPEEEKKGYSGKDLQKRKVLSRFFPENAYFGS